MDEVEKLDKFKKQKQYKWVNMAHTQLVNNCRESKISVDGINLSLYDDQLMVLIYHYMLLGCLYIWVRDGK